MSDNKADLVNILAGVMAACANEGDYDPVEDYIHDPFCRRVDAACGQAIAEIARLRKLEADCKAANLIGPDGNVRKVLGTIPLTADGCVIGNKAYLWNIMPGAKGRDDDRPMRVCYKMCPIDDPDSFTDGPMRMWSTPEAAEAARKEAAK